MNRFFVQRAVGCVLVTLAAMTIMFGLFQLLPGDPTAVLLSDALPLDVIAQTKERWGLNDPLPIQYLRYMGNLLSFDFGTSFLRGTAVRPIIMEYLGNTLVMMVPAVALTIVLGLLSGAAAGWFRGTFLERAGVMLALFFRSVPSFFVGIMVLAVFAYGLQWFPSGGMLPVGSALTLREALFTPDLAKHLALPTMTMVIHYLNGPFLVMRTAIVEVKGEDFFEVLRAKGLPEWRIVQHAMRNAILPTITYVAVMVGFLFQGQVLVETVFAWPGIGRLIVTSLSDHDYPVAQAAFFITALVVILMNFAVDLVYTSLDPRVNYD